MTAQDWEVQRSAPLAQERAPASARWAITAVFFLNGLALASYIVRLPSIKADHHLSDGQLGLVGTLFGATALVAMQFVGALVAKFGSARVIRLTMLVLPLLLIGVGMSRDRVELAIAVMLVGAVHGTLDVAMNAHAVAVERLRGRPIMNGCHAAWSISAALASLLAAAIIGAGVSVGVHLLVIGVAVVLAGLVVGRHLLPAAADQRVEQRKRTGWRSGWSRTVMLLGAMGTVLMICEGAALTWSGVFLHESRGATLAMASIAVTVYTTCQTGGRVVGDRLKERYGAPAVFRIGGLIATAGCTVAFLSTRPAVALVGFAVFGLGGSVLLPLTFSAVGHLGGQGPGAAAFVARFSTFTYAGILLGPAVIGWIADGVGLAWTLTGLIPLLGIVSIIGLRAAGRPQAVS